MRKEASRSPRRVNIMQLRQIVIFYASGRPLGLLYFASFQYSRILVGEFMIFNCETASITQNLHSDFLSLEWASQRQVITKNQLIK